VTAAITTNTREKGRVVEVAAVFGTMAAAAPGMSRASRAINTVFVEWRNGADRRRNAQKALKTCRFSKDRRCHEAVTHLTLYGYNCCCPVRTSGGKDDRGWRQPQAEPGDGGGIGRPRPDDGRLVPHARLRHS
jgi:hypothetical protein